MFWHLPWSLPPSETIKLRSCRNLIHHYLGDYLEHITLHQLSVNLHNGIGTVSDVTLNCDEINKFGNKQNWPVKIVEGHMEDITLKVPWSNVFKDESTCKINGLTLTIRPKSRSEPVRSLLTWMLSHWKTFSTRQRLPLNKNNEIDSHSGEGEELFAESIDAILNRLKVKLENTKIRIEHLPQRYNNGVILDVHIRSITCCNDPITNPKPGWTDFEYSHSYHKRSINIEGVTLSSHNFPTKHYHSVQQSYQDNPLEFHRYRMNSGSNKEIFHYSFNEMKNDIPELQTVENIIMKEIGNELTNNVNLNQNIKQPGSILCALLNTQQEMKFSLKQVNLTEEPFIQADILDPIVIVLSPKQIDKVIGLLKGIMKPQRTS